jgi:hypothetical protein
MSKRKYWQFPVCADRKKFIIGKAKLHKIGNVLSAILHIEVGIFWVYNSSVSYCGYLSVIAKKSD